jgi:N-acetylglutamate synthase-like GNAT family acetyltransferase
MSAMAETNIRRGQSADLSAIAALLESAGLPTADLSSAGDFQTWVFDAHGAVLAAIGLERFGDQALLRSLVVAPDHRKRGLGQKLIARLEREARAEGITRLILLTETAEAFFQARGYVITDRRQVSDAVKLSAEFRSLCPVSAVCMSKTLRT